MYAPTLYDTKHSPVTNIETIVAEINRYLLSDYPFLPSTHIVNSFSNDRQKEIKSIVLTGLADNETHIPNFFSPVYNAERGWIAVDLRNFVTPDKVNRTFRFKGSIDAELNLHRLVLNGLWIRKELSSLSALKFAEDAWAQWFSETLTRRYGLGSGLTAGDSILLKTLAYFYYAGMFKEESLTEEDYEKIKIRHKSDLFLSPRLIDQVYDVIKIRRINNVDDLCAAMYPVTDNTRLKGVTYGMVLTTIMTHWFGQTPQREIMMGVLQHPPTWIALVYFSLKMRSFKNTYIAMTVNGLDKKGRGNQFMKEYEALVLPHIKMSRS